MDRGKTEKAGGAKREGEREEKREREREAMATNPGTTTLHTTGSSNSSGVCHTNFLQHPLTLITMAT